MSAEPPVSYEALTDKWVRDIHEGAKSTEALDAIVEETGSRTDAIAFIVAVCADSHFQGTHGEVQQHLSAWHSTLKYSCSQRFSELTEGPQQLTREEANADQLLQVLNGVRRGTRRALRTSHSQSEHRRDAVKKARTPNVIDAEFFEYRD